MLFRLYPLVIVLQVFCLYHAYSNKTEQKWFWIIFFFPFIGSLVYLYVHFYSRNNIDKIKEEIKVKLIQNYTITQLEQKVEFSGTFANKLELANEHLNVGNYDRAIEILESCSLGSNKDDVHLKMKLLHSYYLKEDYNRVIEVGKQIEDHKEFQNSRQRVAFAWSIYNIGDKEEADRIFSSMDNKYSNYENRLEYAYFLQDAVGEDQARDKMDELMEEINLMDSYEKRLNKKAIKEIQYFNKQL